MTTTHAGDAAADRSVPLAGRRLSGALRLAASPIFLLMALLAGPAGATPEMLCGHGAVLGGMVPMYLLMAAFHLPAWLRLLEGAPHQRRR